MKVCEARNVVKIYDELVCELNMVGIQVEEIEGYSDRDYSFIGARDPDTPERRWLFTGKDFYEFEKLARVYLMGRKAKDA